MIVPWRGGCPDRERAWRWVRHKYETEFPQWEIIESSTSCTDTEPWIKAHAVRDGLSRCDADTVVIADADVWTDGNGEAVASVESGAVRWAIPFRGVFRLSPEATLKLLAGRRWEDHGLAESAYLGVPGGGIVTMPRQLALEVPFDPRFVGWGGEDTAIGQALWTLAGPPRRVKLPLVHLWHPPQARISRRHGSLESRALEARYIAAANDAAAMRALLDEIEV